ncbi:TPA: FAD-dependent oxidoreductase, partial [Candidatus Micrarchaeota archaeon]|nr:FAD-dependent oxidoreductase [Candidatus Micrarchaeota archaeon]
MRSDWDVVVVGGGPAGLFFAIKAAERGLDVLVLDKKQEIGSPVRCAEGLGADAVEMLISSGLPDS